MENWQKKDFEQYKENGKLTRLRSKVFSLEKTSVLTLFCPNYFGLKLYLVKKFINKMEGKSSSKMIFVKNCLGPKNSAYCKSNIIFTGFACVEVKLSSPEVLGEFHQEPWFYIWCQ